MEYTCKHCDRFVVQADGLWVDPEATGDDSLWRETCDAHDTFQALHEVAAGFVQVDCCDGTGWTGIESQPCAEHYEPLDSIWRGHL